MNSKNCIVLVTHKQGEDLLRYISHVAEVSEGTMDFYVLFDNSNSKPHFSAMANVNVFEYNSKKLDGFFFANNRLLPNALVALLDFAQSNHYDHYLLMEFDIVLNGRLGDFVNKVNSIDDIDYIHIGYDPEGGPENHWPIKYIKDNPFRKTYFAWCHIFYISHNFLVDIEQFMTKNNSFHYEFLLPTMAYNGNYIVKQFENIGYQFNVSWGPVDKYETIYKECARDNTFYHPIKDLSIVTFK
ncbi:hypothetical protein [Xylanibacter muris]|uniref:Glycosyltransferase n=1 Tax=Xylanibacter muris TaxID=2736290 RepID=A0ABX2AS75_9BACT|nr:hypothetical protein [Xylanibacter muris]NPD93102.1 hypothetical protein [Xylanibacter muris]